MWYGAWGLPSMKGHDAHNVVVSTCGSSQPTKDPIPQAFTKELLAHLRHWSTRIHKHLRKPGNVRNSLEVDPIPWKNPYANFYNYRSLDPHISISVELSPSYRSLGPPASIIIEGLNHPFP